MRVVATSDLHGFLPEIPSCDLLLIAGDIVPRKEPRKKVQKEWLQKNFFPWLQKQPAAKTFFIGGNHDVALEDTRWAKKQSDDYLFLESKTFRGLDVWGSPYSLGGAPLAFQKSEKKIIRDFEKMPRPVDIILSHGPMYGFLDSKQGIKGIEKWVQKSGARLFVSGHIHRARGFKLLGSTLCLNAAFCSSKKVPANPLWIIEWGLTGIEDFYPFYPRFDDSAVPLTVRFGKKKKESD